MGAILVTGGSGQVGGALRRMAGAELEVVAPDRDRLDLTDPEALATAVGSRRWTAVVNCAAYTAVDRAESDVVAAWRVNALAPAALAAATADAGIPLVQLSTDYVFGGTKADPYVETDPVGPVGVYGASKEAGEQAVRTANPRHVILRTAWVVSAQGSNFIRTMLRLADQHDRVRVVADQYGCPTGAEDIARAVVSITQQLGREKYGTYHFVNRGEASWADLADAVFARAAAAGRRRPAVERIATADYPTPARRPANSRLATGRIGADYAIVPREWRAMVDDIVDELIRNPAS
jgi:dTDP-4-dehydrorhamnose reductase